MGLICLGFMCMYMFMAIYYVDLVIFVFSLSTNLLLGVVFENLSGHCRGHGFPGDCRDVGGSWQPGPVPFPSWGAGQLGGSPSPGHHPPSRVQGQAEARMGDQPAGWAVRSWRPALPLGQGLMAPEGLRWAPGPMEEALGAVGQDRKA